MNAAATGTGAKSFALIAFAKTRPSTAAGRNAMKRFATKRCAARSLKTPRATSKSLTRYSQHTARIAPAWITISKSFAFSPVYPRSEPATIRCPVDETGRNSVRPSTMPRIAATTSEPSDITTGCHPERSEGSAVATLSHADRLVKAASACFSMSP